MKLYIVLALLLSLLVVNAQAANIDLGTANNFGLLAGTTVTNADGPGTVVVGDIGVSTGTSVTGFPPGTVTGTVHLNDAAAIQAQVDLTSAYTTAATTPFTLDLTGTDLGTFNAGNPLTPGVYKFSSSAGLTGNLVLDGQNNPNAQWIFQTGSTLTTATGATVSLINGAQPCDVFWQIGSSATLGTGTLFTGDIMALTSITLNGGVLNGRALARNGAVTIATPEVVTPPTCVPEPSTFAGLFTGFLGILAVRRRRK